MSFIPNTTPTPNWLYNGEMKKMNETELKVVLLVTRKTLGWFDPATKDRKTQDYISQSKFMEFTGQSNRAIATAIQVCVEHGWVVAKDKRGNLANTPEKRARRKIWYQLGTLFTKKISSEESTLDDRDRKNLVNKTTQSGEHFDINLVKKVHSTKETLTKETNTKELAETSSALISEVIKLFEGVDAKNKTYYGNTTQRKACSFLIGEYGMETLLRVVEILPETNKLPYFPSITSPYELKEKWSKLGGAIAREKKEKDSKLKTRLTNVIW